MVLSVVGEVTVLICACLFLFTAPILLHAKKKPHKMEMTTTEPPPEHHDHYEDIPYEDHKPPEDKNRRYTSYNSPSYYKQARPSSYDIRKDSYYKALLDSYNSAYKNVYQNMYKSLNPQNYNGRFKRGVAQNYSAKVPKDDVGEVPFDELHLLETALRATHELRPKQKISKKKKQIYLKKIINSRRKRSINTDRRSTSRDKELKYKKNGLINRFSKLVKKRLRRTAADADVHPKESGNRLVSIIVSPEKDDDIEEVEEQTVRHHRLLVPVMF